MRLAALTLLVALSCCGATYYIAPTGSDGNPGTEAEPFGTIGKVSGNYLANGDTVVLRGGIYTNQGWYSQFDKTNITFRNYTGETPIFTAYKHPTTPNSQPQFFISSAGWDGYTIDGLVWSNNYYNMILRGYRGKLLNCKVGWYDTNIGGVYPGARVGVCQGLLISNCVFESWGDASGGDDNGTLLQLGDFSAAVDSNCFGNIVLNSKFVYGGHDNVEIYGRSNVFRGCWFYNGNHFPYTGTNYGNRNVGILGTYSSRNMFDQCVFADTARPVDDDEVSGVELSSPYQIVRRSVFHNQAGPACSPYTKGYGVGPSNIYYYANSHARIAMNDPEAGGLVANDLVAIRAPHADAVSNRWVNLIFYHVGEQGYPGGTSNLFAFWQAAAATNQARFAGIWSNTASPLYVSTNWTGPDDFTSIDLRLQTNSPCIDQGAWLTTITSESGSGTSFTVDDAGYFYDGWGIPGEVGDVIQLEGQTNTAPIASVDYSTRTLTLSGSLTWTNGQGVSLAYNGSAPDMGAYETEGAGGGGETVTHRATSFGGRIVISVGVSP